MPGMLVALKQWLRPLLVVEDSECQRLHHYMPCCLYVHTSRVVDDHRSLPSQLALIYATVRLRKALRTQGVVASAVWRGCSGPALPVVHVCICVGVGMGVGVCLRCTVQTEYSGEMLAEELQVHFFLAFCRGVHK